MRRTLPLAFVLLAMTAVPAAAQRVCDFDLPGRTENVGNQTIVFHDPFTVLCRDGAELRADAGRLNQATRELQLNGNVFFRDAGRQLTSDEATYNNASAHLHARGNVRFENLDEGTLLSGPELEYFRETEERPQAQVLAPRRPTLTLRSDPEDAEAEPMELVADRVMIIGEDDLSAFGSVVITRSDLIATSSEARYRSSLESLELRELAHITSDEYDLTAEVIQIDLEDGGLEHVHARTDAVLTGTDARVSAPNLQLFFEADTLRQAVAQTDSAVDQRARARSTEFELAADSILALFVSQQIDEVHAVGTARAVSVDTAAAAPETALAPTDSVVAAEDTEAAQGPDGDAAADQDAETMNPAAEGGSGRAGVLASDWIEGDTIFAYFEAPSTAADSIPGPMPEDTTRAEVEMRRLVAIGGARSLYRIEPEVDRGDGRRNVNFLVGDRIELVLQDQELSVADVQGLRRGIYLEAQDLAAPPPLPPEESSTAPDPGDPAAPDGAATPDPDIIEL